MKKTMTCLFQKFKNRKVKTALIMTNDAILALISISVALFVFSDFQSPYFKTPIMSLITLQTLSTLLCFQLLGIYRRSIRLGVNNDLMRLCQACFLSVCVYFPLSYYLDIPPSFTTALGYLTSLYTLTTFARNSMSIILNGGEKSKTNKIAIYGAGKAGLALLTTLKLDPNYNPEIFIDDDPNQQGLVINGVKVHSIKSATKIIRDKDIDSVLVAIKDLSPQKKRTIVEQFLKTKVKVKIPPGMTEWFNQPMKPRDFKEIEFQDLFLRPSNNFSKITSPKAVDGQCVLVTGAGGSIGSELAKQILGQHPQHVILLDNSEYSLYNLRGKIEELNIEQRKSQITYIVGSITDRQTVFDTISRYKVNTIFHAAALKHVPLMEENPIECVRTNVFGTQNLLDAASKEKVGVFAFISTDKAVEPSSVMGQTKRLGELLCISSLRNSSDTSFSIVRFGNVVGSSGSVIPLFKNQIENNKSLTITHKETTRYFMAISEAVELVIASTSLKEQNRIFVLDMGQPVKIIEIAKALCALFGRGYFISGEERNSEDDVELRITGLRPGEKLHEKLSVGQVVPSSGHPNILMSADVNLNKQKLQKTLAQLTEAIEKRDDKLLRKLLRTVK